MPHSASIIARMFQRTGTMAAPGGGSVGWSGGRTRGWEPRRPPRTRWRTLRALGTVAGALSLLFAAGFLLFVASLTRYERNPGGRSDAIVALTGGSERITDAVELLAKGYGRRLLITGVNERTSREEIARLNPGQRRLFDCCVDLDYRARNTIGNAVETRRWVQDHGFRSLIVVTSNYHMPRTLLELDNALPTARKVPFPVVSSQVEWWQPSTARLLVSEYVKYLVGWVRTRIEADPENSRTARLIGGGSPSRDAGPAIH